MKEENVIITTANQNKTANSPKVYLYKHTVLSFCWYAVLTTEVIELSHI